MSNDPSLQAAGGQQFVSATVHLAGAVQTETGHATWSGAGHVMARIGGLLIYFLNTEALAGFAAAAARAGGLGGEVFGHELPRRLPDGLIARGVGGVQEVSLVLRLRGAQQIAGPNGVPARASADGRPHVRVRVGGLVLVLHDQVSLQALVAVAAVARRAGDALWPDEDADLTLPASPVPVS